MVFIGFPENKLKILDYRAKWEEGSREYETTVRNYDFPASDAPLIEELGKIALRCWDTFGLNGYARVDFRVDEAGRPFVLEINANPCIAPDSGFVAAAAVSKLGYEELIGRIVQNLVGPALAGME
jgi:D-alanine-D-alanine ligase